MPIAVTIGWQDAQTKRAFKKLEKRQWPFAMTKAITALATKSRDDVRKRTRQVFDLHTEFIPRNIKAKNASISQLKNTGTTEADVHMTDKIAFMSIHEKGGEKRAQGGALAVPAKDLESKNFRTGRGSVRSRWKVREILANNRKTFRNIGGGKIRVAPKGRKGKAFVAHGQTSGVGMVVRRKGRSRYPLEYFYSFQDSVTIKPAWQFESTVRRRVRRSYNIELRKAVDFAVRTSR